MTTTKFEINKAVAEKLGLRIGNQQCGGNSVFLDGGKGGYFNPCYSWADAGPIIDEYKISMQRLQSGGCDAYAKGSNHLSPVAYAFHESALVAAMLVFLELDLGGNK